MIHILEKKKAKWEFQKNVKIHEQLKSAVLAIFQKGLRWLCSVSAGPQKVPYSPEL